MSEIPMSKPPMRKSTVIALNLLCIVMGCAIMCIGAYLALFTLRDSPTAQTSFVIGFLLNVVAALVFIAVIYIEDVVKAKLKGRRYLKVAYDFVISAFILGLIFLSFWVIDARHNNFRAFMAFTAFPCSMIVIAGAMGLTDEISKCFQAKKPTP